jgi:hypothetical protein
VYGQGGEAGARGGTQDQERSIPHQKMRRHMLNLFQGFCFSLIKKGAGTCLIYSRVSVSPSPKGVQARAKFIPGFLFLRHQMGATVQARAKCIPGFLLLPHQKGCRHVLNSRVYLLPHKKGCRHVLNSCQGFCFSIIKKGAGTCLIYSRVSASPSSKRVQSLAKFI